MGACESVYTIKKELKNAGAGNALVSEKYAFREN